LPKSYYIKKIIVNLDKTKLYPRSFEPLYIEVNVPEFKMRLYQDGYEIFSSEAIVGRLDRPTPIFSDKLEYIVVNPTWTIPESLVKKDLIPALKQNPNILEIAHIKAYQRGREVTPNLEKLFSYENSSRHLPYQFIQEAGADNALGRVKFMFPNRYSVYLHDTPEKGLFNHRYRYNSSGCMRINDPKGFFRALQPYLNTSQDIESIIASDKTTRVTLKRKIPVHIVYFTLEFENGAPKFLYDAYMYDKIIEESTQGNIKNYFEVPAVRLKEVRR
jgi:murein L,D-transpeptidase YcbB/YkuD